MFIDHIPVYQDPSEPLEQGDQSRKDERHREPSQHDADRCDESEFGKASEIGEREHEQRDGCGRGRREDRRSG